MTYHYTIPGAPVTKKNHQQIMVNHKTGKPFVGQSKRTIISSEMPLKAVRDLDEATASRIFEKARGYVLNAPQNAVNWREK